MNWRNKYVNKYADLQKAGINTYSRAISHWNRFGINEGRIWLPLVSIIVPVYNVSAYIRKCLLSLINQSYKNVEIIIVNDKSTDNTEKIILDFIKGYNNNYKIKLINNDINKGTYISINTGINNSNGEYICKLDGDDIYNKYKIEKQIEALLKNNKLVCYSKYNRVTATGRINNTATGECTILFKKDIIINKIGYFDSNRFGADTEFTQRINKVFGNNVVININEVLYIALLRPNSLTTSGNTSQYNKQGLITRNRYVSSYVKWHNSGQKLYMDFPLINRKF